MNCMFYGNKLGLLNVSMVRFVALMKRIGSPKRGKDHKTIYLKTQARKKGWKQIVISSAPIHKVWYVEESILRTLNSLAKKLILKILSSSILHLIILPVSSILRLTTELSYNDRNKFFLYWLFHCFTLLIISECESIIWVTSFNCFSNCFLI